MYQTNVNSKLSNRFILVTNPLFMVLLAVFITFMGALESLYAWPYSPYLWGHAFLCVVVPLMFRVQFGYPFSKEGNKLWTPTKGFFISLAISLSCIVLYLTAYYVFQQNVSFTDLNQVNLWYTMKEIFHSSVEKYGQFYTYLASFFLLAVWAPFGEELFYRRFMYRGMRAKWTFLTSALISAMFFGLRHSLQLLFVLPDQPFPIISAVAYFIWAGMFGFIFAWAYEKTNSIWVPTLLHALNLIWAPIVIFIMVYH